MVSVTSYGAPGNYIKESQSGAYAVPIIPINSIYLFAEIESSVSSSLDVGFPYNIPTPVYNLNEFEDRLAGGVPNAFSVPTDPFALATYTWVKAFFRNVGAGSTYNMVSARLYIIRVKPVPGIQITVGEPTPRVVNSETVYSYGLTINGFRVGETHYDDDGNPTYIGVVVDPGIGSAAAASKIVDSIRQNVATDSATYVRHNGDSNIIELYPRLQEQSLEIVPYNEVVAGLLTGVTTSEILSSDDPSQPRPRVEAKDYIYSIDNCLDPTVHELGSMAAPVAFMKFTPEHRQAVGMAMENRTRADDLNWVYALIDCAPRDGRLIALHYGFNEFELHNAVLTADPDPTQNEPFFIYETQGFYKVAYDEAGLPETTLSSQSLLLPIKFTDVLINPVAGVEIPVGTVLSIDNKAYGVKTAFTPVSVPITVNANVEELKMVVDYTQVTPATPSVLRVGDAASKTALSFTVDGDSVSVTVPTPGLSNCVGRIQEAVYSSLGDIGVVVSIDGAAIEVSHPDGATFVAVSAMDGGSNSLSDLSVTAGSAGSALPSLYKGQVLNNGGSLSWVKSYFKGSSVYLSASLLKTKTEPDIPAAYYQHWIEYNSNSGKIQLATYDPTGDDGKIIIEARDCTYNCVSASSYLRDGLMYTSPNGSASYEYPYWVDFEGLHVPQSALRAGIMMKAFRTEGFHVAPAGARYPANGVLRPVVEISRSEQTRTNPRGMNAGNIHPNSGPVLWGANTVSRRIPGNLFIWQNTRQIMSVAIATLRNAFDELIFRPIDSQDIIFRTLRSTAEDILYRMYRGGALYGASPSNAYRVICNKDNNPDFNLELGIVNIDIFIVPVSTLEEIHTELVRTPIGTLSGS